MIGLGKVDYRWCDNYARGILRCHLARGDTLFICMEEKACSFFGHCDMDIAELYPVAAAEIMRAVERGCRVFYFGGYGAFNSLCHKIVTKIKDKNPELKIKRIYCFSQERYLRKHMRAFRPEDYDDILYLMPSPDGWRKSVYFRNCAMIDQSDLVIFGLIKKNSRTYMAYKYAKRKRNKQIVSLCGK